MTLLDVAACVLLFLIAMGGYRQGLIRGLVRAAALSTIAMSALILSISLSITGSLRSVIMQSMLLILALTLMITMFALAVNRLVPRRYHTFVVNRVLGVIPALVQGLLIMTLAFGLIHRLAFDQNIQLYLERGIVTGPLIQPVSWLERTLAGVQ